MERKVVLSDISVQSYQNQVMLLGLSENQKVKLGAWMKL